MEFHGSFFKRKMKKFLIILLLFSQPLFSNEIKCYSPKDIEGYLIFNLNNDGLSLQSCKTKQQICNQVDFEHIENHKFKTSGSFIFNGSHSETLVFDGLFENLTIKTDYALSRSGDPIKSKNIQSQFFCEILNSV